MMTAKRYLSVAVVFGLVASMSIGCGGEPETPPQPGPPDAGPPPPPPPPVDAGVVAVPAPQVTGCNAQESLSLTGMLQGRAAAEAPGMQPEGSPVCSVVPEGQTVAGQTMVVQQGFCYTFLGQALPGVTELDMQVELDLVGGGIPPALAALAAKPVLQVDSETGVVSAIGAKQNCFKWALPIPAAVKLVLKPRAGSGPVAAQAYKKKQ
jgi:hypothetical protein